MKIKNIKKNNKMKKTIIITALASTLALSTLTGCNYDFMDFHYQFNKAIIFGDNTATIIEIKKWTDYDGEQLQIETEDGALIVTSSFDTKLINDLNSNVSAEDIAKSIKGEDVEINYLGKSKSLTLKKEE